MSRKEKKDKKDRKEKKKSKIWKSTVVFIILDLCALAGFFVMYGPFDYVRNLYVTTAMQTMNHQYLARVFYSEKTIEAIMSKNYISSLDEDANLNDIVIDTSKKTSFKDEYEKELLTREPGNDLYKILNVNVGNANGYLVAIYDPKKVKLLRTKKFNAGTQGERVSDMCKRYGGTLCINGGGFANGLDNGSDVPLGHVIDDGKVVWPLSEDGSRGDIIGLTNEGKLKLVSNSTGSEAVAAGIEQGLEFGPFLIVNGKSAKISGTPYGVANKCVIAQRKDGVMMFLVTEGETYIDGASLSDVVTTLERYGAYNAANLDGGQSTSLVVDGKLVNSPNYLAKKQGGRYVVTGWGLIP